MKKILVIFLLIFIAGCATNLNEVGSKIQIDSGDKIIEVFVEIADDNAERSKGLMFRENMDENKGMFFIFDTENMQSFWMKNTLIPLDIIFIDKNLKIINIENAVPCQENPCQLYKSEAPSMYVLELNAGFSEKNEVRPGDKIKVIQ